MALHPLLRGDFFSLKRRGERGAGKEGQPLPGLGPNTSQMPFSPIPLHVCSRIPCPAILPPLWAYCPHSLPFTSSASHSVLQGGRPCGELSTCLRGTASPSAETADVGSAHLKIALPGSRRNSWALMEFAEKLISANWQQCQALPGPNPS